MKIFRRSSLIYAPPERQRPDKTSATTTREETTLKQNWIQCRVGERGITTPVHYDDGQNIIGMITGAKRYILLPPNQRSKLSIFTDRDHSLFQHSKLNSGRMGNQQQQQQDEQQQGDNNNYNMLGDLG
ncbi:cupin-like domain containing protein [Nitzschia inconspicua]|uniref:Cupin-like domain containing protein n=1 Tax=Nitzschia inconspicua TaxID=303405 RepID=A0A9K3M0X4_9STRA|nr:cupin-like domain containing protein [Nitzschia inconspicua]KAG7371629.1 cupin-like domain containing protein [Nitzschia inconspicua]